MIRHGDFLFLSIWCSVCFLYLSGCVFPWFGEVFCILVKDLVYAIDLKFFSSIYSYDVKLWPLHGGCPTFSKCFFPYFFDKFSCSLLILS